MVGANLSSQFKYTFSREVALATSFSSSFCDMIILANCTMQPDATELAITASQLIRRSLVSEMVQVLQVCLCLRA